VCGASPVKMAPGGSCVWTSGKGKSACRDSMAEPPDLDDDTRALIEQLCTRAGMLMEDASVEALVRASSITGLKLKAERIGQTVQQIHQLFAAAEALLRPEPF
jgi:hypothetical protein